MSSIEYHTIRWSEIRLPHPTRPGEFVRWKVDGPFALRRYYRVEGTDRTIELDLSHRSQDGTLTGCLCCGAGELRRRVAPPWGWIALWLVLGLGAAPFTYGVSLLVVAYPLWFLWAAAPRIDSCPTCAAEFVDFRRGPRV